MSQQYQEYPKVMVHPNYKPAVIGQRPQEKDDAYAARRAIEGEARSEYMPAVTVYDRKQEEQHAALGYTPQGTPDPGAYQRALAGVEEVLQFAAYPKWKYHAFEEERLVENAAEEKALGPGWYDRPDLVPAEPAAPVVVSQAAVDAADASKSRARRRAQKSVS